MGQCIGQSGDNVEAGLKGSRKWDCEKSMENHAINCSTKVWLLPNSQHLFFNTKNSVTPLYQYLDTTREQLGNSQGCLSADEHSWIVSCRVRWSSTPETVLAPGFIPWFLFVGSRCLWGRRKDAMNSCNTRERAGLISTQTCTHLRAGQQQMCFNGLWSSLSHSLQCSHCLNNH